MLGSCFSDFKSVSEVRILTHLVTERTSGEERVYSEFKELSSRSPNFVFGMVIGEDLLDHETPVAMRPVIGLNFRRTVKRPDVQRMLHDRYIVGHLFTAQTKQLSYSPLRRL